MKKKLNFIVDNNNSSDALIKSKILSELGEDALNQETVIFGADLKIGQTKRSNFDIFYITRDYKYYLNGERGDPINDNGDIVDVSQKEAPTYFRLKAGEQTEIPLDISKTIVVLALSDELLEMVKDYYSEDTEMSFFTRNIMNYSKDAGKFILNETSKMNEQENFIISFPNKNDTYHGYINVFHIISSNDRLMPVTITVNTTDEIGEDGKKAFEFVYDGKHYKFIDGKTSKLVRSLNIESESEESESEESEFVVQTIDELQADGIESVVRYMAVGGVTLCDSENGYLPIVTYDENGIMQISKPVQPSEFPVYEYSINGIETDKTNFVGDGLVERFSISKIAGGISKEVVDLINGKIDNTNSKIDNTNTSINAISQRVEQLAVDIPNEIKNDFAPEEITNSIISNETLLASLSNAVMEKIRLAIVAKNGDEITSNLTYDEERNAYVLDYDTSLLDGTDYSIEFKIV